MEHDTRIFGFYIEPIESVERGTTRRWSVLKDSDHLLRRFGDCEVLRMGPEQEEVTRLRPVADELWCLLEGAVDLYIQDQRDDSPTKGIKEKLTISVPTRVLIPFGVQFSWSNHEEQSLLIRLNTHSWSPEAGDRASGESQQ